MDLDREAQRGRAFGVGVASRAMVMAFLLVERPDDQTCEEFGGDPHVA